MLKPIPQNKTKGQSGQSFNAEDSQHESPEDQARNEQPRKAPPKYSDFYQSRSFLNKIAEVSPIPLQVPEPTLPVTRQNSRYYVHKDHWFLTRKKRFINNRQTAVKDMYCRVAACPMKLRIYFPANFPDVPSQEDIIDIKEDGKHNHASDLLLNLKDCAAVDFKNLVKANSTLKPTEILHAIAPAIEPAVMDLLGGIEALRKVIYEHRIVPIPKCTAKSRLEIDNIPEILKVI